MSSTALYAALAGAIVGVGATLVLSPDSALSRRAPAQAPPVGVDAPRRSGVPSVRSNAGDGVIVPGSIGPIADFLQRSAYATAYDRKNRIPAWTAEHLTAASLRKAPQSPEGSPPSGGDRSNSTFREDEDIPAMFRSHLLDYFKSGYDRGHMVPAADAKISQRAMDETFLLSNVAPQVGDGFNRHYWAYVEAFCRNLTKEFSDVYVFTIPLFLPRRSNDGKWRVTYEVLSGPSSAPTVAVPTHFAKVILASRTPASAGGLSLVSGNNREWSLGAFVLPNEVISDQKPLLDFVVPVDAVESSAGLTLFPDSIKAMSRPLCQTTKCQLVVRRFDDAQKKVGNGGNQGGKKDRRASI